MVADPESTARLWHLCQSTDWNPDPADVVACVRDGADVVYAGIRGRGRARGAATVMDPLDLVRSTAGGAGETPILHGLVAAGRVEAVTACLTTTAPLDFSLIIGMGYQQTVLHLLCASALPASATAAMLAALVRRLQTHPLSLGDKVEWLARDSFGKTFFDVAAWGQRLSVVWPLVRELPYFADFFATGFPTAANLPQESVAMGVPPLVRLRPGTVWEWDWEALRQVREGDDETALGVYFQIGGPERQRWGPNAVPSYLAASGSTSSTVFVPADRATARLCELSWLAHPPEAAAVTRAVQDGGRLFFCFPGIEPPLFCWVRRGEVDMVRACLEDSSESALSASSTRLDFTQCDAAGCTVLHYIWSSNQQAAAAALTWDAGDGDADGDRARLLLSSRGSGSGRCVLRLLLERLARRQHQPAADLVDWSTTRYGGRGKGRLGFLSRAAECGCLADAWALLKEFQVPYFFPRDAGAITDGGEGSGSGGPIITQLVHRPPPAPIPITVAVTAADWDRVPESDKPYFSLEWDWQNEGR